MSCRARCFKSQADRVKSRTERIQARPATTSYSYARGTRRAAWTSRNVVKRGCTYVKEYGTAALWKTPPCFWANAGSAAAIVISNPPATTNVRMLCFIFVSLPLPLRGARFFLLDLRRNLRPNLLLQAHLLASRSKHRRLAVYHR